MRAIPEADSESVNARLADFFCGRKEEMIKAWIGRLQRDPAIATKSLDNNQLRDHLPRLFDDLADLLRRYGSEDVVERTERDAEKHGMERWQQGFSLTALLREIMHLRGIFIHHLRVFEEAHSDFGTAARLFAHSTVHQFLDHMAIDATQEFLAADKQARRETSGVGV